MAIIAKRKKTEGPTLPAEYHRQATDCVRSQVVSQFYEEQFKARKGELTALLDADPNVQAEQGKSLRFPQGLWRPQARANYLVDPDRVREEVQSTCPHCQKQANPAGRLTIETVLSLVMKFNIEALSAIVPEAVSEGVPTSFVVMQGTPEFKAAVLAEVEEHEKIWAEFREPALAEA